MTVITLFETLALKHGMILNLCHHNTRFRQGQIFLNRQTIIDDIATLIKIPTHVGHDKLIRCRVTYNKSDVKVEYFDYTPKTIHSFKVVECDDIDYGHKYDDRSLLNHLLSQKESCDEIIIIKNGKIITVVPKYLTPPFTGVIFNQVVKYFDSEFHDLTITQTATQLLSQYCIYIYPNFLDKSPKLYAVAFYLIASKYAGVTLNEEQRNALISKTEVSADELDDLIKEIETSLADF